jgi:indole-3-glycerol phosphate synthase
MSVLERILESKRREVSARQRARPLAEIAAAARRAPRSRGFAAALERPSAGLRVIGEVKKASPSRGVIREDFDPVAIARAYEAGGAAAISVLTDEEFFAGSLEHLEAVRRSVSLPLLRKDFLIDRYQVLESRAAGADAVLLILAALDDGALRELAGEAERLGMDVLWEVHDLEEARRVRQFSPRLVGVNNRDLRTFEVSLETTRRLVPELPEGALVVSESGFSTREELEALRRWGAGAFLIGESLVRARDPAAALRRLVDGGDRER